MGNEWSIRELSAFNLFLTVSLACADCQNRMKPDIWTPVARELGIPWRAVEAMHWHLGEQEMARRAGVTPFAMAAASGPSPSSAVGPSSSVTGLSSGGASLPSQGGSGSRLGMEGTRSRSESDSGGEPRRRRRREGGVHGGTMLPSLAEMEGGAPVYDEDEEEDEGAGS